jgi:hypothetical protein
MRDTADMLAELNAEADERRDGAERGRGTQMDSSASLISSTRGLISSASLEQLCVSVCVCE